MKKTIKTLFIVFFGLIAALALAVVIAPTFFKDKLVEVVKKEVNARVEGEVDFSEVDVTWWSSFPDVSVALQDLYVTGAKSDTTQSNLLTAKSLSLGFDFMSVWSQGDSLEIKSFQIDEPHIFVLVDDAGKANYDLVATNSSPETTSSSSIKFDLSDYTITNGQIRYIDRTSGMDVHLQDVDHTGSLTYDDDNLILDALLKSDALTYQQDGIAYLNKTDVNFDGKLNFDLANQTYTFLENDLMLNALQLFFDGSVTQNDDDINFNVKINTRKNTFESFLSLLPNMYSADFDKIKTRGNLTLNGQINGILNITKNQYPKYSFNIKVDDGWFQLPEKSEALSDIFINASINNNGTSFDPTKVNVPVFRFTLNGEEIKGNIDLDNKSDNQIFNGAIAGKLNLADLSDVYPMPGVSEMSGLLDINATFAGNSNAVARNDMSQLSYDGYINGSDIQLEMDGQPSINLKNISSEIKDDRIDMSSLIGQYGQTDFSGSAQLSPISSFITESTTPIKTTLNISGNTLNLNEFLSEEPSASAPASSTTANEENLLIKNLVFDIKGNYDKVVYEDYDLKNINTDVSGSLQKIEIKEFDGTVNNGPVSASGQLTNVYGYTYLNETLGGRLNVNAASFDVDDWMVDEAPTTEQQSSEETSYAVIPDRMDMVIDLNVGKLNYDKIDVNNAKGQLVMKDQRIAFNDIKGQAMNGDFGLDGYYQFDGSGQPLFKLDYDVSKFSFEETFNQVETAKFLLPIIKFLKGTFNSNMSFEGALKPGYMPDLTSIDGAGLLETFHATINNSQTLNKISQLTNLDALNKLSVERTKNRFSVENGTLSIDPFEQSVDDIHALISGSHKLTGDMNYKLALTIPTEKFNRKGFPINLKEQFNSVQKKLQKFGMPLEDTESVRVDISLTGSLTDPKIGVKLVDFSKDKVGDAVKNMAKQAKDSVTTVAKTRIIDAVSNGKDSTSTTVKDAVKTRAEEEVKKKIEEEVKPVRDTVAKKVEEAVKDKVSEELKDKVDDETKKKAEEALEKWNPFKKKKKDGG